MRKHCSNGVVFEPEVTTVKVAHGKEELAQIGVLAAKIDLQDRWNAFAGFVDSIRAVPVTEQISRGLVQ